MFRYLPQVESSMPVPQRSPDDVLREALEANGQRFTGQRSVVYRFLSSTDQHPTADEVFLAVCGEEPVISLATVYNTLETLVGCGLAVKLGYADGSARYDGRTDEHHHARCLVCSRMFDLPDPYAPREVASLSRGLSGFQVTGFRLELTGHCEDCAEESVLVDPH